MHTHTNVSEMSVASIFRKEGAKDPSRAAFDFLWLCCVAYQVLCYCGQDDGNSLSHLSRVIMMLCFLPLTLWGDVLHAHMLIRGMDMYTFVP
mmetsp:Transcript_19037/g.44352  ORF Transcript_19037/g.44352 Transcript_19037/m.44352 type:complete len:92 (-) Transcript_19037:959-1234(-)